MNKIGIIGAMAEEVEALINDMDVRSTVEIASMVFHEGTLNGTEVVVVQSGMGKVPAGMCVQILSDKFDVTHVINTGVAGSLCNDLNIGDIVVSEKACQHDFDLTPIGFGLCELPYVGDKYISADETLAKEAVKACKKVNPDINCIQGIVATGDQFIASEEAKNGIIRKVSGICAEMEGGAIAQACFINHIPFIIIRAISDKADHSSEMDFPTFTKLASKRSTALVEELVSHL